MSTVPGNGPEGAGRQPDATPTEAEVQAAFRSAIEAVSSPPVEPAPQQRGVLGGLRRIFRKEPSTSAEPASAPGDSAKAALQALRDERERLNQEQATPLPSPARPAEPTQRFPGAEHITPELRNLAQPLFTKLARLGEFMTHAGKNWLQNLDPRGKDAAWKWGALFGAGESALVGLIPAGPGSGLIKSGLNLALAQTAYIGARSWYARAERQTLLLPGSQEGLEDITNEAVRRRIAGTNQQEQLNILRERREQTNQKIRNFFLGASAAATYLSVTGVALSAAGLDEQIRQRFESMFASQPAETPPAISPAETATLTPSPSPSPSPSVFAAETGVVAGAPAPAETPTATNTPTVSATETATASATITETPTAGATETTTSTATPTATETPAGAPPATETPTGTATSTATATETPTGTAAPAPPAAAPGPVTHPAVSSADMAGEDIISTGAGGAPAVPHPSFHPFEPPALEDSQLDKLLAANPELAKAPAGLVGEHFEQSNIAAREALAAAGIDPAKLSDSAYEKVRTAVQHKMEEQANASVVKTAELFGNQLIDPAKAVETTRHLFEQSFEPNTAAHQDLLDAAKSIITQQQAIHNLLLQNVAEEIAKPEILAEEVLLKRGDTVGQLLAGHGYDITWGTADAEVLGAHIAANHELLSNFWGEMASAGNLPEGLHYPADLSEISDLVEKAKNGDAQALQKLKDAIHWVPSGRKFKILSKAGVGVLSVLK